MSNFSCSGVIVKALPVQEGVSQRTGTAWARASYVIQHEIGQYPKSLVFEVNGPDKIKNFGLAEGQQVTVHLAISCREYQGRYYNQIEAWKVDHIPTANQPAQPASKPAPAPQPQPAPQFAPQSPRDEMPF